MPVSQPSVINLKELFARDYSGITMNQGINRIKNLMTSLGKLSTLQDSKKSDQMRMFNPLIYHSLKNLKEPSHIPGEKVAQMKKEYYLTAASNIKKLHAATKILQMFKKENVFAIPVKGVALIEALYHDPAVRPMADIDFLIKIEDFQKIKDILINMGYNHMDSYRGSFIFENSKNEVLLDLHSKFTRYEVLFNIDYDEIYSQLRKINFNEQIQVEVLCPEHQLIHIALHLAPGLYSDLNLLNLIDMFYLISDQDNPIDWEYLVDFAKRTRTSSYIYAPIYLCTQLFQAGVPQSVLSMLEGGLSRKKTDYIQNGYFPTILNGGITGLKIFFERLTWAEGFSKKLKLLRMALLPERREMVDRYHISENSPKIYILYISRLWTLFREIFK
jgi:hypothetical protein